VIEENFSLLPYQKEIERVSANIDLIEKEIRDISIKYLHNDSVKDNKLAIKQQELLLLKKEHQKLVKMIRYKAPRSSGVN
jgi:hypothetical protein